MTSKITILQASPAIQPLRDKIKTAAKKSFQLVKKYIPIDNVDIVIFDHAYGTIKHLGVGGYAPNSHTVLVYIDPKHKAFQKNINEYLLGTIAHELHHVMRWRGPGYGKTLFEALITEGLADHFETEVRGGTPGKWDTALTDKEIQRLLKLAKKEFDNENYNHAEWFFGSKKRNIPYWTGYSLGFYLVGEYLKRYPNKKASSLYSLNANKFR